MSKSNSNPDPDTTSIEFFQSLFSSFKSNISDLDYNNYIDTQSSDIDDTKIHEANSLENEDVIKSMLSPEDIQLRNLTSTNKPSKSKSKSNRTSESQLLKALIQTIKTNTSNRIKSLHQVKRTQSQKSSALRSSLLSNLTNLSTKVTLLTKTSELSNTFHSNTSEDRYKTVQSRLKDLIYETYTEYKKSHVRLSILNVQRMSERGVLEIERKVDDEWKSFVMRLCEDGKKSDFDYVERYDGSNSNRERFNIGKADSNVRDLTVGSSDTGGYLGVQQVNYLKRFFGKQIQEKNQRSSSGRVEVTRLIYFSSASKSSASSNRKVSGNGDGINTSRRNTATMNTNNNSISNTNTRSSHDRERETNVISKPSTSKSTLRSLLKTLHPSPSLSSPNGTRSNSRLKLQQLNPNTLLTSKVLTWLILSGIGTTSSSPSVSPSSSSSESKSRLGGALGGRIYYCIEERLSNLRELKKRGDMSIPKRGSNESSNPKETGRRKSKELKAVKGEVKKAEVVADFVGCLYEVDDSNDTEDEKDDTSEVITQFKLAADFPSSSLPFIINGLLNSHQDLDLDTGNDKGKVKKSSDFEMDALLEYPAILAVPFSHKVLHFAPATILNLFESVAFANLKQQAFDTMDGEISKYLEELCGGESEGSFKEGIISGFYVPLENAVGGEEAFANPLISCHLRKLTGLSMRELIDCYVCENLTSGEKENGLASALDILPDGIMDKETLLQSSPSSSPSAWNSNDGIDQVKGYNHHYCVIANPTVSSNPIYPKRYDDDGQIVQKYPAIDWEREGGAVLVQYLIRGDNIKEDNNESKSPSPSKQSKAKVETTSSTKICKWRACLCTATHSSPKYLCDLHSDLKLFLDKRTSKNSSSESQRFLPKTSNSKATGASDLENVKAASSLLLELENGKLCKTIESFCNKSGFEGSEKYLHDLSVKNGNSDGNGSESVGPDSLARSRSHSNDGTQMHPLVQTEINRHSKYKTQTSSLTHMQSAQRKHLTALAQILKTEAAVNSELDRLQVLGVYPEAEMIVIRRICKEFDRDREYDCGEEGKEMDDEIELSDRKLQLLKQRRLEVEDMMKPEKSGGGCSGSNDSLFFPQSNLDSIDDVIRSMNDSELNSSNMHGKFNSVNSSYQLQHQIQMQKEKQLQQQKEQQQRQQQQMSPQHRSRERNESHDRNREREREREQVPPAKNRISPYGSTIATRGERRPGSNSSSRQSLMSKR